MSHNVNPWKYYKTKNQVELNLNWWNGKPRTMRSLLCRHVTRTSPENRQYKWFSHHCSIIKPRFPEEFKPFSEIRKLNLQKLFFLFWLFTGRPMLDLSYKKPLAVGKYHVSTTDHIYFKEFDAVFCLAFVMEDATVSIIKCGLRLAKYTAL